MTAGMKVRSEDHILALIDECFPRAHGSLALGRGDDCAEIAVSSPLALSTDLFIEDRHFRRSYFLPEETGHKALAVNISDLASAGARPLGFSLGLICPDDMREHELAGVFSGMGALAARYNMVLSGGDISAGDKLGFAVTVWGAPAGNGVPFLRRRAKEGDAIFIVGPGRASAMEYCSIGLARRGLALLEEQGRAACGESPASCAALLRPQPQVEAGLELALLAHERNTEPGLMDLSDGLLRDLPRLLGGLGAELEIDPSVLHPELDRNYVELALSGGDDYLLLGAAGADFADNAKVRLKDAGLRLDVIGRVVGKAGIFMRGRPVLEFLNLNAFDHFEEGR